MDAYQGMHACPIAKSQTLFITFLLLLVLLPVTASEPPVQLAGVYHAGIDLRDYWVSEKLDGVRAYWDGQQLISRNGNPYPAPQWFTRPLPKTPLDGELWIGRNRFEELSSIVRTESPNDADWGKVRYMVFDLPQSPLLFSQRLQELEQLIPPLETPWIELVVQFRVESHQALMAELARITDAGGEGLMLHRSDARHQAGRGNNLLKVKRHQDAEARVIGHLPGKGKYQGMLGALLVETADGRQFRVGTGFSDRQRANPPPLGATITYRYRGTTKYGIPRFPSFMRIRDDP